MEVLVIVGPEEEEALALILPIFRIMVEMEVLVERAAAAVAEVMGARMAAETEALVDMAEAAEEVHLANQVRMSVMAVMEALVAVEEGAVMVIMPAMVVMEVLAAAEPAPQLPLEMAVMEGLQLAMEMTETVSLVDLVAVALD